jgi:hypothetical protein
VENENDEFVLGNSVWLASICKVLNKIELYLSIGINDGRVAI